MFGITEEIPESWLFTVILQLLQNQGVVDHRDSGISIVIPNIGLVNNFAV
jgi:hypothetical protein